ncbi:MAG: alpha-E domain-containing protein [Fimbriiglobus sp.]
MISRVAEHCFWMARYLERAENKARLLEVNYTLLLDLHLPTELQWQPLLIISGIGDNKLPETTAQSVQEYMTWSDENPFSIASSLYWARENARIIREVISAEMWERINFYYRWMKSDESRTIYDTNRSEFYNQIRRINQLISGICDATMSHDEAWEFFRLGKYLERACQTARILDVKYHIVLPDVRDVGSVIDTAHWTAILMSCSGYEPFHKIARMGSVDTGIDVAEFLIHTEVFPRSISRCIAECREASAKISDHPLANLADEKLAELHEWIQQHDIRSMVQAGLHESLTHIVDSIHNIGDAIQQTYFDGNRSLLGMQTQSQTQSQH